MTMHETTDKIASDKLHNIQLREIAALRRENAELIRRLSANSDDIEIHRGKVVFIRYESVHQKNHSPAVNTKRD